MVTLKNRDDEDMISKIRMNEEETRNIPFREEIINKSDNFLFELPETKGLRTTILKLIFSQMDNIQLLKMVKKNTK